MFIFFKLLRIIYFSVNLLLILFCYFSKNIPLIYIKFIILIIIDIKLSLLIINYILKYNGNDKKINIRFAREFRYETRSFNYSKFKMQNML